MNIDYVLLKPKICSFGFTDENFNFKIPILHIKVPNIEIKAQISNKYQCFLTKRILCLRGSKQIKN